MERRLNRDKSTGVSRATVSALGKIVPAGCWLAAPGQATCPLILGADELCWARDRNIRKAKLIMRLLNPKAWWAATAVIATVASVGFSTLTAGAATAVPTNQTGEVHSCITNGRANVTSSDGGQTWKFVGPGSAAQPYYQYGVVHSDTTGGNANVRTWNGGLLWQFWNNGGPLLCQLP
jgi:hypothetical protein